MPEKDTLYLVIVSYTKEGTRYTDQDWRRAPDSFSALKDYMDQHGLEPANVWAQGVYSAETFREKELEVE